MIVRKFVLHITTDRIDAQRPNLPKSPGPALRIQFTLPEFFFWRARVSDLALECATGQSNMSVPIECARVLGLDHDLPVRIVITPSTAPGGKHERMVEFIVQVSAHVTARTPRLAWSRLKLAIAGAAANVSPLPRAQRPTDTPTPALLVSHWPSSQINPYTARISSNSQIGQELYAAYKRDHLQRDMNMIALQAIEDSLTPSSPIVCETTKVFTPKTTLSATMAPFMRLVYTADPPHPFESMPMLACADHAWNPWLYTLLQEPSINDDGQAMRDVAACALLLGLIECPDTSSAIAYLRKETPLLPAHITAEGVYMLRSARVLMLESWEEAGDLVPEVADQHTAQQS